MDSVALALWLFCGTTIFSSTVAVFVAIEVGRLKGEVRRLQSVHSQAEGSDKGEDGERY